MYVDLKKKKTWQRPTLPHSYPCSTIGAEGLYFCVRNGNRCDPFAIAAGILIVRILKSNPFSQAVFATIQ